MNSLLANLKKDFRLLTCRGGWLGLVLPVLVLLAGLAGLGGPALQRNGLQPFLIAVRDEDGTPMSRSLTDALSKLDIVDGVVRAGAESDDELFGRGCAAVLTLPKDFFYNIYDLENSPVTLVQNSALPVQATVFTTMISSVLDIIRSDQAAALAVRGDTPPDDAFYEALGRQIFDDAMGRQNALGTVQTGWDEAAAKKLFVFSCAAALTLLFCPLCVLKTLPEEMSLGVLRRAGPSRGRAASLAAAKVLCAFLVCGVLCAGLARAAGLALGPGQVLSLGLAFFAGFGFFALLSLLLGSAARTQLAGNTLILASLVLGGALYPVQVLPRFWQAAARLCLPYWLLAGLQAPNAAAALRTGAPLAAAGAVCCAGAAALAVRRTGGARCAAPGGRRAL